MFKKIVSQLVERVIATKKINVVDPSGKLKTREYITKVLDDISMYIEYFNSLPEYTSTIFNGRALSDVIVADEWKDFIHPESVRLDPTDLKTENLLVVANGSGLPENLTYNDWLNLQLTFRSWFKRDLSQATVTLASLRAPKSLMDILPIARFSRKGIDNDVRSIDDPFIPVNLKPELDVLFRVDYLNTTTDQVLSDWIAKFSM